MNCPKCGTALTSTDDICPTCGNPINLEEEISAEPINKKAKKKLDVKFIIIVLILLLFIIGFGIFIIQELF